MKDSVDKQLNDLTKKVLQDASLEHPSLSFTEAIMSRVTTIAQNSVTVYKPLISKKVWILISIALIAVILFIVLKGDGTSSGWLQAIDYSIVLNNKLTNSLLNLAIPKTFLYGILLFGVMFCIQIPFLSHHFNQRLKTQ